MTTPVPDAAPSTRTARRGERERVLAGRYRVGRRIGAGGMATIMRGTDTQMDRAVALKVLHPHLADDPEVRDRFRAEARHAASLSHSHVVAVYDQGEADLPYIVLELVDGPSLREVLATHGPLSARQVLTVLAPLADALDAAHAIGLIHRDVKPENVLVTTDGRPKLADFGIARVMAATSHTATGTLVGSVHYLAPELVDGAAATPASDQYALGVMAFELLTNRKPLPADTPMAIALRHANEDIPAPSRYAPEVPRAVDAVVARATAHDPADRYPDMGAFAAALAAAVDDEPAPVTHLSDDGQLQTLVLPTELAQTTALATRPARTAAEADLVARRREATPPQGTRPPRRWPRRLGVGVLVLGVLAVLGAAGALLWTEVLAPGVPVPTLVGSTQGEAFAALEDDGLRLDIVGEEHRLDVPAGEVLTQDPEPGVELREGEVVAVTLSLGPQVVEMPRLLEQPVEEVLALLEEDHFEVVAGEEHHDTVPEGLVIAQLPDPGTPVEQGSRVDLVVSLGIEQVEVPDLAGLDRAQVEAALAEVRLTADVSEEWSDEQPEAGLVVSQGIGPAETVDALSTVPVVLSRGPLTIEVPPLRGLSVADARAAVEALGAIELEEYSDELPSLGPFTYGTPNEVREQIPEPGTPIQRGGTIEIYYYRG